MIRAEDVRAGRVVRVLGNSLCAHHPVHDRRLRAGDVVTLTGESSPGKRALVLSYEMKGAKFEWLRKGRRGNWKRNAIHAGDVVIPIPMVLEQVKPGVRARVLKNDTEAPSQDDNGRSHLEPGDVITLDGDVDWVTDAVIYGAHRFPRGYMWCCDLELLVTHNEPRSGSPGQGGRHPCVCPIECFAWNGCGCRCGGI